MLHNMFAIGASVLAVVMGGSVFANQSGDPIEKILLDAEAAYKTHVELVDTIVSADDMLNRTNSALANRLDKEIGSPAEIELVDLRFVLIEMARTSGANEQLTVLRAQPKDRLKALSIQGGTAALHDVMEAAEKLGFVGDDGVTIPIVVQSSGKLLIAEEDLVLDARSGAFLANFGRLEMFGASVVGNGAKNPNAKTFRPFVLTTGTGSLSIQGAVFQALGFGSAPAFSGFALIEAGLYRPTLRSSISGTLFRDVNTTFIQGTNAVSITDTIFQNSFGTALELRNTKNAFVHDSLFLDAGGDALRVSQNALGTKIKNTEIHRPRLNGILVDVASHSTSIHSVTIWKAHKASVSVEQSDCVSIRRVRALRPSQKGISVRTSRASTLAENSILGARGAGLFIAEQPKGTVLTLINNRIAGNRDGISTAAPAEIQLKENDFSQQFPRFMKGDLSGETSALIADLKGENPFTLKAGGLNSDFLPPLSCSPETES